MNRRKRLSIEEHEAIGMKLKVAKELLSEVFNSTTSAMPVQEMKKFTALDNAIRFAYVLESKLCRDYPELDDKWTLNCYAGTHGVEELVANIRSEIHQRVGLKDV